MGHAFEEGKGVERSYFNALWWYRKAADQGDAEALLRLGSMFEEGRGVQRSDLKASEWYRRAADQGDAEAQLRLSRMLSQGRGADMSEEDAAALARKAAEQGLATAQFCFGEMLSQGKGVARSYKDAVYWWKRAADQGDVDAQCALGWMLANGTGTERSDESAIGWWKRAADQGDARAEFNLGYMIYSGRYTSPVHFSKPSYLKGIGPFNRLPNNEHKWLFASSAYKGYGPAALALASMTLDCLFPEKDNDLGSNPTDRLSQIARLHLRNKKDAEEYRITAMSLLNVASDLGVDEAESILELANSGDWMSANLRIKKYLRNPPGSESEYDMKEAFFAGDATAAMRLGDYYSEGRGGEPNYPLALEWYEEANRQGVPKSRQKMERTKHLLERTEGENQ